MSPVGCHRVGRGDGTQGHRVLIGTLVAHDAHTADGGKQDDTCLPDLMIQGYTIGVDIFAQGTDIDIIGILQDTHFLGGDVAQNTDSQTRTGEGMTRDEMLGHAQLAAHTAYLVLEQPLQRFTELQLHVLGQSAHIMMALDDLARDVQTLNAIGINGALCQPTSIGNFPGFGIENLNKVATDNLTFLLRVGNACKIGEELL